MLVLVTVMMLVATLMPVILVRLMVLVLLVIVVLVVFMVVIIVLLVPVLFVAFVRTLRVAAFVAVGVPVAVTLAVVVRGLDPLLHQLLQRERLHIQDLVQVDLAISGGRELGEFVDRFDCFHGSLQFFRRNRICLVFRILSRLILLYVVG